MPISAIDMFSSTNVMLLGHVFTLKRCFRFETSINLVVEEISRKKPAVQTPITYFIYLK